MLNDCLGPDAPHIIFLGIGNAPEAVDLERIGRAIGEPLLRWILSPDVFRQMIGIGAPDRAAARRAVGAEAARYQRAVVARLAAKDPDPPGSRPGQSLDEGFELLDRLQGCGFDTTHGRGPSNLRRTCPTRQP